MSAYTLEDMAAELRRERQRDGAIKRALHRLRDEPAITAEMVAQDILRRSRLFRADDLSELVGAAAETLRRRYAR